MNTYTIHLRLLERGILPPDAKIKSIAITFETDGELAEVFTEPMNVEFEAAWRDKPERQTGLPCPYRFGDAD